jgi:hypothetical protein
LRLATRASVALGLMAAPEAPYPVSCVAITAGGLAFRSMTPCCAARSSFCPPDRAWSPP